MQPDSSDSITNPKGTAQDIESQTLENISPPPEPEQAEETGPDPEDEQTQQDRVTPEKQILAAPPPHADVWPRPPFYLRFPWILAGPLAAAMILWLGSGAVLSATIAAPRSNSGKPVATIVATPTELAVALAPPSKTPAPSPTVGPTATPEATATPKPTPTPFPLAVFNTGGEGVFINDTAGGGKKIKGWPDGTILQVIGEDQQMYGQTWRNVRDPNGNEGWVPAQYLVDPSSLPAPTATPKPKPATATPTATATVSEARTATPAPTAPPTATAPPAATAAATRAPTSAAPTAAPAAAATSAPPASPTPRP